MTFWVAGSMVASALLSGNSSKQAASTQAAAADKSGEIQKQIADQQLALQKQQYEEGVARQAPWLAAGKNALTRMQAGEFAPPTAFNATDPRYAQPGAFKFGVNDYQQDPGYAFRLSEGQKALERTAAARGGLISGGALKAATRYGQDMGSQEYQNAYNRALTGYGTQVEQSNTAFNRGLTGYNANVARSDTGYNRLAGLAGVGQTTGQQLNAAGQNYAGTASTTLGNLGTNTSNALMAAGNATAAGQLGMGNTLASGLQTAASSYQNQMNFNDFLRQNQLNIANQSSDPLGSFISQRRL